MGKSRSSDILFFGAPKSLWTVIAAMDLTDTSLEKGRCFIFGNIQSKKKEVSVHQNSNKQNKASLRILIEFGIH